MNNVYKFEIAPFETDFEFEYTFEAFDEFQEELQDIFPEYDEAERLSLHPESRHLAPVATASASHRYPGDDRSCLLGRIGVDLWNKSPSIGIRPCNHVCIWFLAALSAQLTSYSQLTPPTFATSMV